MARKKGKIYIGTSGWSYDWKSFYPKGVGSKKRLGYYSQHFSTAEVNYSFYRLPKETMYQKWFAETEEDFIFTLKLSRFITHIKKLKGIKSPLRDFCKRGKALGAKLGPILVQLPPSFQLDVKRLGYFLETAGQVKDELDLGHLRFVFEARHASWFESSEQRSEMLELLQSHKAAFVFAHSSKYPYPADEPVTSDVIYLRLHGPREMFGSAYGEEGLTPWAPKIKQWSQDGHTVFVYFNNDMNEYAAHDARRLKEILA
ncbi:DUF72 domain-containing protein [bacterium]|nr:DUF72 domain-containing protein [bacterium]